MRKSGQLPGVVAMVPESQLWTLEESHRVTIVKGLAWAAQTEPRESDPDSLLKTKDKPRNPRRNRRK